MNANDHVPMVHILPFGLCKKGMPCMPLTPLAWVDVNKKHIIEGAPALTEDSKLACFHGGVISIVPLNAGSAEEGDRNENAEDSVESIAAEALDIAAGVFGIAASILSKGKIKPAGKKNVNKNVVSGLEGIGKQLRSAEELAKSCPIKIPSSATIKEQAKSGYDQIRYKWSDDTYKYEARWHTRTPGAPENQGNTWVIERKLPGEGARKPQTEILTGENQWTPQWKWQEAIAARKNGTATAAQDALLSGGHWPAP